MGPRRAPPERRRPRPRKKPPTPTAEEQLLTLRTNAALALAKVLGAADELTWGMERYRYTERVEAATWVARSAVAIARLRREGKEVSHELQKWLDDEVARYEKLYSRLDDLGPFRASVRLAR